SGMTFQLLSPAGGFAESRMTAVTCRDLEGFKSPCRDWAATGWAAKGQGMTGNTKSSWGTIARSFHWILGLTIIGMIAYGWWMTHLPARADRFFYRSIHADVGYLVLLLTVIRLIWRSINPTPDLPGDTPRWLAIAARVNHWALYLVT